MLELRAGPVLWRRKANCMITAFPALDTARVKSASPNSKANKTKASAATSKSKLHKEGDPDMAPGK